MFAFALPAARLLGGVVLLLLPYGLTWRAVLLGAALSLLTFFGSLGLTAFLLIKLPANYFHSSHARAFMTERHRALRLLGLIIKNILGLFVVAAGIVMSLPGVPGQGVLTILLGIMLLDFPGKRELEVKLVRQPKVLSAINRVRARFDRPPLLLD